MGFISLAVTANCRREVSAAENTQRPAKQASETTAQPVARIDETAFSLSLSAGSRYIVGQQGMVQLELRAKAPHHVNQEYPHKLKLKPEEGVTFPRVNLSRDSMKIEQMTLSLAIPFTASHTGEVVVAGEFAFSLCTADRCLIEKRALATRVLVQ